ncbi:hypothetical protein XACJJ10_700001 [Xanthomonas citri pv. citri]|nr:hypothetical protein XACLE3_2930001 [Xanthomonas citri pv. citri]CEH46435.1 hypothetical protein XACLG97_3720001 [Xanthomonas citri pv. citri]CEH70024.1 hypothetical protein XACS582_4710001 [Xanthomonas citri pv. citri]CEH72434.1 hypothetical protein XAC3607_1160001 [Xanthomonas citri pv. citri]CEH93661.1 hypothetical protein XACLH37_700001 [Xanthomonas citri pv. citri]
MPRLGALATDAATPPAEQAMQVVPAGQTTGTAGMHARCDWRAIRPPPRATTRHAA